MKIKQVIPNLQLGRLFRYIDVVTDSDYMNLTEDQAGRWYYNKSANKDANDFVEAINPYNESGILTDTEIDNLSKLLNDVYGPDWIREFTALTAEYNPIENYDRNEDTTLTDTVAQRQVTGSAATDNFTHKHSGYDNATLRDADKDVNEIGQRVSTESAHTDTHRTNGRIHGNVGVTTNQQMITSEIEMRLKYHMLDLICRDIDRFITIKHYTL